MSGFMIQFEFNNSNYADYFISKIITLKDSAGSTFLAPNIIINPDCTILVVVKGIRTSRELDIVETIYDNIVENRGV